MPSIEKLFPEDIHLDGGTQPRAKINKQTCAEYGEQMKAGEKFPPIDVFFDGENYWLADGFHRIHAYVMAMPGEAIECNVYQGSLADAQWHSYGVNRAHGLQRTPKDKERAVRAALGHANGVNQSDRQVAEYVGVSHPFVAKIRAKLELSGNVSRCASRTVTRGNSTYQQNTAKIGRKSKKRRSDKPSRGMATRIAQPTRAPQPMEKMTALNMPHDPFMGAMTLIEVFDVKYLRSLVETITNHLGKELSQ